MQSKIRVNAERNDAGNQRSVYAVRFKHGRAGGGLGGVEGRGAAIAAVAVSTRDAASGSHICSNLRIAWRIGIRGAAYL